MSLADRLAQARRDKTAETFGPEGSALGAGDLFTPVEDPFRELKLSVHQSLIESLGPKLYDSAMTQAELEQRVRSTLQEVLSATNTPLTVTDRANIAQEIADSAGIGSENK